MNISDLDRQKIQHISLLHALDNHAIVSISDRRGRIIYANEKFCEISGYSQEELLGNNHRMIKSGIHPPELYKDMWNTIIQGRDWEGILCNKTKENNYYWVKTTIAPVLNDEGVPYQFISIRTEITQTKRNADNLFKKNQLLSLLNDTAKVLLNTSHDELGRVFKYILNIWHQMIGSDYALLMEYPDDSDQFVVDTYFPEDGETLARALQTASRSPAELVSRHDITAKIFAFGRVEDTGLAPALKTILHDNDIQLVINVPVRVDDKVGFLLSFLSKGTENFSLWHDQIHLLEILSDVLTSAHMRTRQEKELVLQKDKLKKRQYYANVGDWDMDIESNLIHWSANLFGFGESTRQIALDDYMELILPQDRKVFQYHIERCKHQHEAINFEYRLLRSNGETLWVQMRGSMIIDDTHSAFVILATLIDVSRNKQTEQELILAREAAERANSAKSEFLSNMSHELRTPLNSILGFSQLMEMDPATNMAQRENLSEIVKAGKHLLDLINDILDLSMLESGNINIILEPIDVRALVKECITLLKPVARKDYITLLTDDLPDVHVYADNTRLKQALINLISNGIKYNRPNGRVIISVEATDSHTIDIHVSDTGMGIDPQKYEELFQPFNRLGLENTGKEGTGIGLSFTRKMVHMMGGDVSFESQVNKGSRFSLHFPTVDVQSGQVMTAAEATAAENVRSSRNIHILYVDAVRENFDFIHRMAGGRENFLFKYMSSIDELAEIAKVFEPEYIVVNMKNQLSSLFSEQFLQALNEYFADAHFIGLIESSSIHQLKPYHRQLFANIGLTPLDNGALKSIIGKHLSMGSLC
ncbi:MAG: PAS domain S-box protein [Gammaproteobacteria bacterium]|nr:MAG: PAS domain S-box protein [Gammaproteobacteria bacterium]